VTDDVLAAQDADDAKLLNLVRAGETGAFEILRQRHEQAARRLARELVGSAAEVDQLVAQTFAQVLDVTTIGGGPTDAFRPYLLTALRLACDDCSAAEASDVPEEKPLMAAAFFALPESWIAVLWHTEIESASSAEVAPLLGLSPDGVAALRRRAREGLRQSYLHLHSSRVGRAECKPVADQLGAFVRDPAPGPESALVTEHLSQCDDCRALYADLADVNLALRTLVAPVILGRAAAPYLSGAPREAAATSAIAAIGSGGMAGLAAGESGTRTGRAAWFSAPAARHSLRPARVLVAAAVIAVCSAGFAVSLAGHDTPLAPGRHPGAAGTPHPTGILGSTPSERASALVPVASTRAPSRAPSSAPAGPPGSTAPPLNTSPSSSVTASSPPAAELTASVNVYGQHHWRSAQIVFQINDTGSAATGEVTVSIRLPAGTWLLSNGPGHGQDSNAAHGGGGGWSCQPTSAGASCQHAAISPRGQAQGVIYIGISGSSACGQPVSLTATSGSASASAQSPQDIQCLSDNQD
jgi:DNA-directed RNA polymerase specialized sigma24 family protein